MTPITIPPGQGILLTLPPGSTYTITTAAASTAECFNVKDAPAVARAIPASTSFTFGPSQSDTRQVLKCLTGTVTYVFAYP